MTNTELEKLRKFCDDFKKYLDTTVDGNGSNLHDIKVTFDHVKKTIDQHKLSGTTFGENLSSKADSASKVLSQLWNCLDNLEKSVRSFCDYQEINNKQL